MSEVGNNLIDAERYDLPFLTDPRKREMLAGVDRADTPTTKDDSKKLEDTKKPTAKPLTSLKQTVLSFSAFGAALSPTNPLAGAGAHLASASLVTLDAIGEWTNKNATRLDAAEANKTTQPSDPNNKVLNTNDRSVLDHHQAVNGLLPGQLNNSRTVFTIKQNQDGTSTLAFKYDDDPSKPGGDERYGKIELDKDGKFKGDWQAIEKDSVLRASLDKAHDDKMKEIDSYTRPGEDRSAGVERYRAAESVKHDLDVLKKSVPALNTEEQTKLNALEKQLEDKTNIDPRSLKNTSDEVLKIGFTADLLANTRANALGDPELSKQVSKAETVEEKNKLIDNAINEKISKQQTVAADEMSKLDLSKIGKLSGVNDLMLYGGVNDLMLYGLKNSDQFKSIEKNFSPEEINTLKSLMSASKTLRDSYDPKNPDSTQAKYIRNELAYLNSRIDPFLPRLEAVLGTSKSTPRTQSKTIPEPNPPSQN